MSPLWRTLRTRLCLLSIVIRFSPTPGMSCVCTSCLPGSELDSLPLSTPRQICETTCRRVNNIDEWGLFQVANHAQGQTQHTGNLGQPPAKLSNHLAAAQHHLGQETGLIPHVSELTGDSVLQREMETETHRDSTMSSPQRCTNGAVRVLKMSILFWYHGYIAQLLSQQQPSRTNVSLSPLSTRPSPPPRRL